MREASVESGFPTAAASESGAWLTTALRERERRSGKPRGNAVARGILGPVVEPSIDLAACAAWLAATPARDDRKVSR